MFKSKTKPSWYVGKNSKDEDIKAGIEMGEENYANSQAAIDKEKWREKQEALDIEKALDKKAQEERDRIIEYGNEREDLGNKIREYESREDLTEQDELELDRLKKRDIELQNKSPWYYDQRYQRHKEREKLKKGLSSPLGMEDSDDEEDVEIASSSSDEMGPESYEKMMRKKLGYV